MTKEIRLSFKPTNDDMKVIKNLEKKLGVGFSQLVRLGLRQLATRYQESA